MTYSPIMIANNILSRAFAEKSYMSPMKLQKILYFVAAEYQKETQRPLLAEPFSTWAYGPVVRSVYDEFRTFSKNDIDCYGRDARGNVFIINEAEDPHLKRALDRVWDKAKRYGAVTLSEITHLQDSAWYKAYQNNQAFLDPDDITADTTYYESLGLEGVRA